MFLLVIFYFLLILNDSCNKLNIYVKEPVKGPRLVAFKMQLHIAIYLVKVTPTSCGPTTDHRLIRNYLIFILSIKIDIYPYT